MRVLAIAVLVLTLGVLPATTSSHAAGGATDLGCLALVASTIGPGDLNVATRDLPWLSSDLFKLAPPGLLPPRVYLRTSTESYNRKIDVALRNGHLFFRPNTTAAGQWRQASLPSCIDGRLTQLSLDDDELVAIDAERHIYTMDNALSDPLLWNWTSRWGALTWTGPGRTLQAGIRAWSWSVISQPEDGTWTDPAGNQTTIGQGKVSHVFMLAADSQHIPWIDPWLPNDDSYHLCGPLRGRFKMANLSASGSTIFVIGRHGDMFTRLYDFDLSGADTLFFGYSYDDQRGAKNPKIQLPSPLWVHQPKVPGKIRNVVSIEKTGRAAIHRTLRVEGSDRGGHAGYWEKDSTAMASSDWRFHPTPGPLQGRALDNPRRDTSHRGLGASDDAQYTLSSPGMTASLTNFDPYCSPARLQITIGGSAPFSLFLHTVDGLRQATRGPGLDNVSREYEGAIEVPPALRQSADRPVRDWLQQHFGQARFTTQQVYATRGAISLHQLGWLFGAAKKLGVAPRLPGCSRSVILAGGLSPYPPGHPAPHTVNGLEALPAILVTGRITFRGLRHGSGLSPLFCCLSRVRRVLVWASVQA